MKGQWDWLGRRKFVNEAALREEGSRGWNLFNLGWNPAPHPPSVVTLCRSAGLSEMRFLHLGSTDEALHSLYSGMLFSRRKKQSSQMNLESSTLGECQTQKPILYDSVYMKCPE